MTSDGCEICRGPKIGSHICDQCRAVIIVDPVREDYLDYPTAWRIQREGLTHLDPRCSAIQTDGALLCDCAALTIEWHRRVQTQEEARH